MRKGFRWSTWLPAAVAAAALVAGCTSASPEPSASESPTPSPTASPTPVVRQLAVGDCASTLDPGVPVSQVTPIDCEANHAWEVFAVVPVPGTTLPDQGSLQATAIAECVPAFTDYVGVSPDYSRYRTAFLVPDKTTWDDPTLRRITCLLGADGPVTGSAKGDTAIFPEVGECTGPQDVAVLDLDIIDCAAEHNYEVYAEEALDLKEAPTGKDLTKLLTSVCEKKFTSFVGVDAAKSKYEYSYFVAGPDLWDKVLDHRLVCSAGSPSDTITGSLKGSKK